MNDFIDASKRYVAENSPNYGTAFRYTAEYKS